MARGGTDGVPGTLPQDSKGRPGAGDGEGVTAGWDVGDAKEACASESRVELATAGTMRRAEANQYCLCAGLATAGVLGAPQGGLRSVSGDGGLLPPLAPGGGEAGEAPLAAALAVASAVLCRLCTSGSRERTDRDVSSGELRMPESCS